MTFQVQKAVSANANKPAATNERTREKSNRNAPWSAQKHARLPYKPGLPLSSGGGGDGS